MAEEKKSVYDGLEAPDYMGDVDSTYKEVNNEVERQERQARLNSHAAILGDMARLWADSAHANSGGWGIKEREPMAVKANERWEKIKQGKAAMKGQYAKDRAAARQQQLAWDLKVAQGKAQEAERAQQQQNWDKQFAAQEKAKEDAVKFRDTQFAYQQERDVIADKQKAAELDLRQQHYDNEAARIAAAGARAVRGKQLGFSDGAGKQMAIYENVWKASMPQVFDVLKEEITAARKSGEITVPRIPLNATPSQIEQIVKQNWHKYPRATALMLALSKIDPATMTSTVSDAGDDIVDYVPGGEEIIDYVPGK